MTDFQKVAETFKLKKSDDYCSRKLGMELETYQAIKRTLKRLEAEEVELETLEATSYTEDLMSGTAEYKIKTDHCPKSSQEVEDLVQLDKSKWKVLKYSIRNASKPDVWLLTIQVGPIDKKESFSWGFQDFTKDFKTSHKPIVTTSKFSGERRNSCLLLNKQDPHLNKMCRVGTNDIDTRFSEIEQAYILHCSKASVLSNLQEVVYVVGSDQFNAEFTGMTTKFTPQDNILTYEESFQKICDHEVRVINSLLVSSSKVKVIILSGNHDQYVSWHMGMWLKAYYKNQNNLIIDTDNQFNKYFRYDNTAVMLNHGDVQKPEKLAQTFPIEFKAEWGMCDHYIICTGDKHTEHSKSIGGIKFYQIPALSKAKSMWDMKNGFTTTPAEMTSFLITEGKGITDIFKEVL